MVRVSKRRLEKCLIEANRPLSRGVLARYAGANPETASFHRAFAALITDDRVEVDTQWRVQLTADANQAR